MQVRVFSQNEEMVLAHELQRALPEGEDLSGFLVDQITQEDKLLEILDSNMEGDQQIIASQQKAKFSGEVVGILQRLHKDYSACLHEIEDTTFHSQSKR